MDGWSQGEGRVDLSGCTQVRLNGSSRSEEGRGHGGHATGGTSTEEGWAAKYAGGDWDGTLGEDEFRCITDSVRQDWLLRVWVWVLRCGRRGTAVAHGVAALSDRVAAGSFNV